VPTLRVTWETKVTEGFSFKLLSSSRIFLSKTETITWETKATTEAIFLEWLKQLGRIFLSETETIEMALPRHLAPIG
jgi:hypothetical protein